MVIVIMSACDPTAVHMIRALRAEREVERVVRIVWPRPAANGNGKSNLEKIRALSVSKVADRLHGSLLDRHLESLDQKVARELAIRDCWTGAFPCEEVLAREVNSPATVKRLSALSPDVVIVNGAPILKPEVFQIARRATVNVHFGISPHYRGTSTLFWPLYYRDYDNVGVTLHEINGRLDGGAILAHGYPALGARDTEASIKAKCAVLAAELVRDYLDACERGPVTGVPQNGSGRVFRGRDRTLAHELSFRVRRLLGTESIPARREHRILYF